MSIKLTQDNTNRRIRAVLKLAVNLDNYLIILVETWHEVTGIEPVVISLLEYYLIISEPINLVNYSHYSPRFALFIHQRTNVPSGTDISAEA